MTRYRKRNLIARLFYSCAALLFSYGLVASPVAANYQCSNSKLTDVSGSGIAGASTLCVTPKGIGAHIAITGLTPGDAYTLWWVYFDKPENCAVPHACGEADFAGENPQAVLGRFASDVAPRSGNLYLSDRIKGMKPRPGSQVWLFLFGHGAANYEDKRQLARQLLTPEDPNVGVPHLGNHIDGMLGVPTSINVHIIK